MCLLIVRLHHLGYHSIKLSTKIFSWKQSFLLFLWTIVIIIIFHIWWFFVFYFPNRRLQTTDIVANINIFREMFIILWRINLFLFLENNQLRFISNKNYLLQQLGNTFAFDTFERIKKNFMLQFTNTKKNTQF